MKKMQSWLSNGKMNVKDEYYTPKILVDVIIPFIDKDKTVWCPFDTEHSEFVLTLKEQGIKVVHSHIKDGQDFFNYEPEHYDYIISNPPFSCKLNVLKRLYELDKPFAMVLGLPILNYQEIGDFFLDKDLQLLIVNKKISFDGNTASFNSSYFCRKLLPKDLMFHNIEHNNTKSNYKPSRMYLDFKED
jgi:hypothetical protein